MEPFAVVWAATVGVKRGAGQSRAALSEGTWGGDEHPLAVGQRGVFHWKEWPPGLCRLRGYSPPTALVFQGDAGPAVTSDNQSVLGQVILPETPRLTVSP